MYRRYLSFLRRDTNASIRSMRVPQNPYEFSSSGYLNRFRLNRHFVEKLEVLEEGA